MEFLQFLMKNWMLTAVFIVSGILLFMWPLIQRRFSPAKGVSTLEATRLMNAGSIIVLDVRSEADYLAGHLHRAINIPFGELKARLSELEKKSAKSILVYCERGQRSLVAAKLLKPLGKTVHNLQGGIAAWREANLPVDQGAGKSEEKGTGKKNGSGKKSTKKKFNKNKKTESNEKTDGVMANATEESTSSKVDVVNETSKTQEPEIVTETEKVSEAVQEQEK